MRYFLIGSVFCLVSVLETVQFGRIAHIQHFCLHSLQRLLERWKSGNKAVVFSPLSTWPSRTSGAGLIVESLRRLCIQDDPSILTTAIEFGTYIFLHQVFCLITLFERKRWPPTLPKGRCYHGPSIGRWTQRRRVGRCANVANLGCLRCDAHRWRAQSGWGRSPNLGHWREAGESWMVCCFRWLRKLCQISMVSQSFIHFWQFLLRTFRLKNGDVQKRSEGPQYAAIFGFQWRKVTWSVWTPTLNPASWGDRRWPLGTKRIGFVGVNTILRTASVLLYWMWLRRHILLGGKVGLRLPNRHGTCNCWVGRSDEKPKKPKKNRWYLSSQNFHDLNIGWTCHAPQKN